MSIHVSTRPANGHTQLTTHHSPLTTHQIPFPGALSLLALLVLALVYFSPFPDLDYTWQIRTGDDIIRTGSLQQPDSFSYTIAGKDVPDFEWLYEVMLSVTWQWLGYGGLKFLKTLLVLGPLGLLGWRLRSQEVPRHHIFLSMLLAMAITSLAWNLRPLAFTTMGLLLVSGWLHDHCTSRKLLPLWLPVVMLIWSNVHPGVITGQALLLGAICWEWLNRWARLNSPLSRAACWRLTWVGGLGLAATFFAPNPLERMLYPFRPELAHPIMRVFVEMQPLYRFALQPPYTAGLVYVLAIGVLVTLVLRFRSYRLWEVALLAGLALLGNVVFRSASDWTLVMLALGVPHLIELLSSWSPGSAREKSLFDQPLLRFQPGWLLAGLGLLAAISLIPPLSRRVPNWEQADTPTSAIDWIEANGLQGNFFAPADYGAYLGWRLPDRAKVYVDTRGFFFPPELLEDCHYLPQMTPGWQQRLDRVVGSGTDYFLLETTGPRGELWRQMQPLIGEPLFLDERSVLLSKRQVQEAAEMLNNSSQMGTLR